MISLKINELEHANWNFAGFGWQIWLDEL